MRYYGMLAKEGQRWLQPRLGRCSQFRDDTEHSQISQQPKVVPNGAMLQCFHNSKADQMDLFLHHLATGRSNAEERAGTCPV